MSVRIDCDTCVVRGLACHDCVVSVLLGPPEELDGEDTRAFGVLADSGLVPPLRLVTPVTGPDPLIDDVDEAWRTEGDLWDERDEPDTHWG